MSTSLPRFVAERKPQWDALERLVQAQREGTLRIEELRELDRLYRQATGDLARAQAFFPGTDAHRFLNQLCARAYASIYRPPRDRLGAVRRFFTTEFPRVVRAEARFVWLSAGLFVLGLLTGALVVYLEPAAAVRLVPAGVRSAVAAREMWTDDLLTLTPPGVVSAAIATNNLSVTILAFASGLSFGLGTLYVLLLNGLQIGAVAAHCVREDMGGPLFGFVGAHGPVELSIIVLSGAAGLMLGAALFDPGELPRSQHLRMRSVQAVKLVVGAAPFLGLIGVVEGYISPGDLFPRPLKIALGLTLGALFWTYLIRAGRGQPGSDGGSTAR